MRFKLPILFMTFAIWVSASIASPLLASQGTKQISIDEVIRRFATAESNNKAARNNYAFTQDFEIVTLGEAGSITGAYKRVSDIVLDDRGNRIEKITRFPQPTLYEITLTKEDLYDLANVQPFGLTIEELPKYDVTFISKEKIDELNTYLFEVKPKKFVKGERYFEGKIWVDDEDLQIVKVAGQAVPETSEHQYPKFESYRENIDEKYWFPTYVYADDILEFKRNNVHVRMTVKFTNYKKFSTGIRIADDDEGEVAKEEKPSTDKTKKPDESKTTEKKPESQSSPSTKKTEPPANKKKPDGND